MKLAYRLLLVVVLLTAFAAPSFASSCPTLIKAANDKMATMDAMSDKVQQAKLLVGEADKLHKAGNHAESEQKANEALSLRNTFFTEFKRKAREPVEDPAVLDRLPRPDGAANPDHRLAVAPNGLAGLDLTAALDRLPEEQRTVVLLADVEDYTMEEVAAILDCPVGTVKSRLFRARATLKELLRDYVQ